MTPQQIELVKSTWQQVAPISDHAAELFYGRLFALDPTLQELFVSDMKQQGTKLMQMISVAVSNLHQLETVMRPIQELGKRHVDYRVQEEHYDTVGEALLWTLEQGLGPAFTQEVKEAWAETYATLARVMKESARALVKPDSMHPNFTDS